MKPTYAVACTGCHYLRKPKTKQAARRLVRKHMKRHPKGHRMAIFYLANDGFWPARRVA